MVKEDGSSDVRLDWIGDSMADFESEYIEIYLTLVLILIWILMILVDRRLRVVIGLR